MLNNRSLLELIPNTLLLEIEKYLSYSDMANVVISCITLLIQAKKLDQDGYFDRSLNINYRTDNLHPFFNSRIHSMQKYLKQAGMCILQGKKDAALEMIDWDVGLLLQVIPNITLKKYPEHSGEKHVGRTLYQLALGTYDKELYEPIGQRIEDKYGAKVKAQQFNEQFPDGVKRMSYRTVFDSLIETIAADDSIDFVDGKNIMNDTTWKALQALELSLAAELKAHATGVHFDLQIVIDFIEAYEEGFDKFKNENKKWDQRALYWRCGFGKLESFMSYFVAMALNEQNDFFGVMDGKKVVTRSTLLRGDGAEFFGLSLGVSHWTIGGWMADVGGWWDRGGSGRDGCIKEFCHAHTGNLGQLKQQLQQPADHHLHEVNYRRESGCQIF